MHHTLTLYWFPFLDIFVYWIFCKQICSESKICCSKRTLSWRNSLCLPGIIVRFFFLLFYFFLFLYFYVKAKKSSFTSWPSLLSQTIWFVMSHKLFSTLHVESFNNLSITIIVPLYWSGSSFTTRKFDCS